MGDKVGAIFGSDSLLKGRRGLGANRGEKSRKLNACPLPNALLRAAVAPDTAEPGRTHIQCVLDPQNVAGAWSDPLRTATNAH